VARWRRGSRAWDGVLWIFTPVFSDSTDYTVEEKNADGEEYRLASSSHCPGLLRLHVELFRILIFSGKQKASCGDNKLESDIVRTSPCEPVMMIELAMMSKL
jgi:hypothetical protein